ncbi:retrovirus-related pol polyprotein from transposon TNT 1-94 [Tanacetum coccineum]
MNELHCSTQYFEANTMQQVHVNTKFLNARQPEWSKFVTDVKLANNLYTTNYDQLYAYLSQHEGHANEVRLLRKRYPDPLALVANHQTQTSSDPRNQVTIQDGSVTVLQVQRRQGQSFTGAGTKGSATSSGGHNATGQARVVKCYNFLGEGNMARQCTQPRRPGNYAWFKEKMLLVQEYEAGQNAAFYTDDLDPYDFDCDDISFAKAVLIANLSSYDSNILSEVPHSVTYQNDMINQCVQKMQYFEQTPIVDYPDNEITSDSNIIPYSQYLQESHHVETKTINESLTAELERYKEHAKTFEQRLNIDLSSHEKFIDSQMNDMIRDRNALKQEIESLKQTLSKQVKEKESLLQTFTLSNPNSEQLDVPNIPVKIEVPKELPKVIQIILWYLDSGCSKHMTGNRSQLITFVHKFLGTVKFDNDQIAKIIGYGDYQMGNVMISQVYCVEGLGHNLFFVRQFCDSDLEVDFCKHTCYIRDLEGVDLLKGSRGSNLYTLSLEDMITTLAKQELVCGLPRLKFQKDHLCFTSALGKSKKHSHKPKVEDSIQEKLYLLHMDLFGPMRIQSINGQKYILVIVDDYSRFTWVKFLRLKDEIPEFVIKFIKMIQVCLNATVQNIRSNNGTEFVNQTLRAYYEDVGISHQTSVARTL